MKKCIIAFSVFAALAVADGALTLYNTPDLSQEANPFVYNLHLGWGALIISNALALAVMFLICWYAFYKYKTVIADAANIREYVSQLLYNRPDKFVWSFYKLPKNGKPIWADICYASYFGICAARLIVVLEWTAVTLNIDMSGYDSFRDIFPLDRFDIVVALAVALVMIFIWFGKEYRKSKKAIELTASQGT